MDPLPNNSRYLLELRRKSLVQEARSFDEDYGSYCFFLLEIYQLLATLAYLSVVGFVAFSRRARSKTNVVVGLWAAINLTVLAERTVKFLGPEENESSALMQMVAGLGRIYGTMLVVVWLYSRYFAKPKPKYDLLLYFLVLFPGFVGAYFVFYYYNVNKFIYEVFGPSCDILSVSVYLLVGFVVVMCKIFSIDVQNNSPYPLFMSLGNLILNFPIGLMTIYVRFNLDISWSYRFHIYFVDLFANMFTASNGFVALFLVLLYHKCFNKVFTGKVNYFDDEEEKNDFY